MTRVEPQAVALISALALALIELRRRVCFSRWVMAVCAACCSSSLATIAAGGGSFPGAPGESDAGSTMTGLP